MGDHTLDMLLAVATAARRPNLALIFQAACEQLTYTQSLSQALGILAGDTNSTTTGCTLTVGCGACGVPVGYLDLSW